MLTIREPITLKANRPIQGIRQDINEKMLANYHLMNLSIRKEELLHITSKPPEIYFAEGEQFQIQTNIKNENKQEVNLEIINNLMNRILVAQTENFTYQDRVFISNVLRKLGIRDEKSFMKQVFLLQNEQKETTKLLQKYENNREILKQLFVSEASSHMEEAKKEEIVHKKESRLFLHDEIYKRLETGKIYQDVRNFLTNTFQANQEVYPIEMQVSEQARAASNLLLQEMKNELMENVYPLQYVHNNRYEYLQEFTQEFTQELEEQISAAILLNLADQTYTLRQSRIEENSHNWYSIAGALFQTAENTWKRYEANLQSRKHFSNQMIDRMEEVRQVLHQEGDVLQNIVNEFYKEENQQTIKQNTLQEFFNSKEILQADLPENTSAKGTYRLTREELELTFLKTEEEEGRQEEEATTVEQLQKQLEMFSRKNYENYKKITEIEKQSQSRLPKERKVDIQRARMDALRAMENPGEVLREYMVSERKDTLTEIRKDTGKQIYEMFSEETKEIYRNFLMQSNHTENTFLQHIMMQPEESEIRQEVVQVLEQIEQQDKIPVSYSSKQEYVKQLQPVISRNMTEELKEQVIRYKQLRQLPVLSFEQEEIFHREEQGTVHIHESNLLKLQEQMDSHIWKQQLENKVTESSAVREIRNRQIDFVYKTEQILDREELLEEIRMQTQKNLKTQQIEEQTVRNERDVRKVIQESVNHIQTHRTEDIEELVQQSMRRQLNQLSEQVYGKLEKKLQTERKRRGYF